MKKKMIALLYVLIMFATFSIGFATWVISSDVHFDPNYAPQAEFDFSKQSSVYDGTVKDVVYPNEEFKNMIVTNYETPFISKKDGVIVDSLTEMKDVGIYEMTFKPKAESVNQYEEFSINYEISKRTLGFKYVFTNRNDKTDVKRLDGPNIRFDSSINSVYDLSFEYTNIVNSDVVFVSTGITEFIAPSITQKVLLTLEGSKKDNYSLAHSEFNVEINAARIKLKYKADENGKQLPIKIDFDSTKLTFDSLKSTILSKVKSNIVDAETNQPVNGLVLSLNFIHNGEYLYSTKIGYNYNDVNPIIGYKPKNPYDPDVFGNNYKNLIGSTYEVYITLDENKYELISKPMILKYNTVKIGSTLYTIEDALNINGGKGNNIVLCGHDSNIVTSFTNIDYYKNKFGKQQTEFNMLEKSILTIPYDSSNKLTNPVGNDDDYRNIIYSSLITNENTVLNLNNSTINIGGFISTIQPSNGKTSLRGVMLNNGVIRTTNSTINSYGFLKGNYNEDTNKGIIIDEGNSTFVDIFRLYDYAGGSISLKLYPLTGGTKFFPIQSYSFHNISCGLKINKTSMVKAHYRLFMSKLGIEMKPEGLCPIIGNNGKEKGLFEITNDGYIIKSCKAPYTSNPNTSLVESNQNAQQYDCIEINADFHDNSITLEFPLSQKISTSTSLPLPVGFMDIHVKNGSVGTFMNNSYKFLPGSRIYIDNGARLTIGNNVTMVAYDKNRSDIGDYSYLDYDILNDSNHPYKYYNLHPSIKNNDEEKRAKIYNDGTIIINGKFGGYIDNGINANENSMIITKSTTASVSEVKSVNTEQCIQNEPRNFPLLLDLDSTGNPSKINNVDTVNGTIFKYNSTGHYWMPGGSPLNLTINFIVEGKTNVITISIPSDDSYTVTGLEFIPTVRYKEFKYWKYNNEKYDYEVNPIILNKTNTSVTLEAFVDYKIYSVNYQYSYKDVLINQVTGQEFMFDGVNFYEVTYDIDGNPIKGNPLNELNLNIIEDNSLYQYKDKGWRVGIIGTSLSQFETINTVTVKQMNDYFDNFGEDLDLYLLAEYYDNQVTIKDDKDKFSFDILLNNDTSLSTYYDFINGIITKNDNNLSYEYYYEQFKIDAQSNLIDFNHNSLMIDTPFNTLTFVSKNKHKITMTSSYSSNNMLRVTIDGIVYDGDGLNKTLWLYPDGTHKIKIEVGQHFVAAKSVVTVTGNGNTVSKNSVWGSGWDVIPEYNDAIINSDFIIQCNKK